MIRNLVRLPVHRTSVIIGIASACMGLIIALIMAPFMFLASAMTSQSFSGSEVPVPFAGASVLVMVLIAPLFYAVAGYISTAIFAFIFNFVAPRLGGLPMEFMDDSSSS